MKDDARICRNCKHWEPAQWIVDVMAHGAIEDYSDVEGFCEVIQETITITECEQPGYHPGDNGIENVETPIDFGCTKWEPNP